MNLFEANHQWATRPEDERFWTLDEMKTACELYRNSAAVETIPFKDLDVEYGDDNIILHGTSNEAILGHYAFDQLAKLINAPAKYLRRLPADLAVANVKYGLAHREDTSIHDALILLHSNGTHIARAITTEIYDRVWNADLIAQVQSTISPSWMVPPARPINNSSTNTRIATEADIIPGQEDFGLSVRVGDPIGPASLYASGHDMFIFMVNPNRIISVGNRNLMRGIFIRNSEVGDCALTFSFFYMDHVCGNHIVWGAENVHEVRVRHMGTKTLQRGIDNFYLMVNEYEHGDSVDENAVFNRAMTTLIGRSREETIDEVYAFAKRRALMSLTKKRLDAAFQCAEDSGAYGSPRSVWGMISGLTEQSQGLYADQRHLVDYQAGKLIDMVA